MKYLDPKNDLIFKKVFGNHPDILKSFLNSMLPLADGQEIVSLEYISSELIPETFLEKFTVVDVRCRDNFDRQFLVEMQMNWTTAFKQRVLFNASSAYVSQSKKGLTFSQLQPVYALNLINQNYLPDTSDYYHHYAIVNLQDNNEKIDGLEFVFIELKKFKAKNLKERKLQVLWLRFLTEINDQTESIDKDLYSDPNIEKAINCLYGSSLTKTERLLYDKYWDRISVEKTLLEERFSAGIEIGKAEGRAEGLQEWIEIGEERGIEKGKAEGKAEAILELACKLKASGMPINEITKYTGLSETEIKELV